MSKFGTEIFSFWMTFRFTKVRERERNMEGRSRPEDNNEYLGILPCNGREGGYYPNVDISIWLRKIFKKILWLPITVTIDAMETRRQTDHICSSFLSNLNWLTDCWPTGFLKKSPRTCLEENYQPVRGRREGIIPAWISGSLVQNGPGKFYFGSSVFHHLFDGSALVRKFCINQGEVTYQCQFVKTQSYKVTPHLAPHSGEKYFLCRKTVQLTKLWCRSLELRWEGSGGRDCWTSELQFCPTTRWSPSTLSTGQTIPALFILNHAAAIFDLFSCT